MHIFMNIYYNMLNCLNFETYDFLQKLINIAGFRGLVIKISPLSIPGERRNVVMPVFTSPFINAHWRGAAPRYFGSGEGWRFTDPIIGICNTAEGRRRKATTEKRSAFSSWSCEIKKSSFRNDEQFYRRAKKACRYY